MCHGIRNDTGRRSGTDYRQPPALIYGSMRYVALATDYDGTLAEHGRVSEATVEALERCRASGRKLLLVTGRRLPELLEIFPQTGLFERVVAENGALLYDPANRRETPLADPPVAGFVQALRRRGVEAIGVGRVIVATWESERGKVLDAVKELGLELQLIFNKGSLMILPSGVNKATGLKAALGELGLSAHNAAGVGDAENDHAFLDACECGVAVGNALPALKQRADWVVSGAEGAGVQELIARLLEDDLAGVPVRATGRVLLGADRDGRDVRVGRYGTGILVAGSSGGGKSTLTTGVLERLLEAGYQFCAVDPEGDYQGFPGVTSLGDNHHIPALAEVTSILEKPSESVILNLLGVGFEQRPAYFQSLLPRFQELSGRSGRPHWIVVDEAHHVLPRDLAGPPAPLPSALNGLMLITLEPDQLAREALERVDTVIAVGREPQVMLRKFCRTRGMPEPETPVEELERGEAVYWQVGERRAAPFQVARAAIETARHSRKYAGGDLPPDRSFYFRGPSGKLNLRAQNLMTFVQMMEGVDDETWLYHLGRGEVSRWFREAVKSDELAEATEQIERERDLDAAESRRRIRDEIEQRYTLAA